MSSGRHKGQFKHTYHNVSLRLSYTSSPVPTETEFTHNVTLPHSAIELLGILIPEVLYKFREFIVVVEMQFIVQYILHTAESQRACIYFRFRPVFVYP